MPLPPHGSAPDDGALMMAMSGRNPQKEMIMSSPRGLTIVRAEVYNASGGPSGCDAILFCNDEEQTQLFCYTVEDCLQWMVLNFVSVDFTVERVGEV